MLPPPPPPPPQFLITSCSRILIKESLNKKFSILLIGMLAKNASSSEDKHILLNPREPGEKLTPEMSKILHFGRGVEWSLFRAGLSI